MPTKKKKTKAALSLKKTKKSNASDLTGQIPLFEPNGKIYPINLTDLSFITFQAVQGTGKSLSKLTFQFKVTGPKVPPTAEPGGPPFKAILPVTKASGGAGIARSFFISHKISKMRLDLLPDEPAIITIEMTLSGARVEENE